MRKIENLLLKNLCNNTYLNTNYNYYNIMILDAKTLGDLICILNGQFSPLNTFNDTLKKSPLNEMKTLLFSRFDFSKMGSLFFGKLIENRWGEKCF